MAYPIPETEWNSNQATLERLDARLRDCYDARMLSTINDLNVRAMVMWITALTGVYAVIYPKLIKDERKEIDGLFRKRTIIPNLVVEITTENGKNTNINKTGFYNHWNLYNKIELRLTELADSRGMLMTDSDSGAAAARTL